MAVVERVEDIEELAGSVTRGIARIEEDEGHKSQASESLG